MSDGEGQSPENPLILHASCVAIGGAALLIRGGSGSGKSGLTLQMMAAGAGLVADDRTRVWREGDLLWADVPDTIRGQIEARQVGILTAPAVGPARLRAIVDMDQSETERLPEETHEELLGLSLPVLKKSNLPHFPAALIAYLKACTD